MGIKKSPALTGQYSNAGGNGKGKKDNMNSNPQPDSTSTNMEKIQESIFDRLRAYTDEKHAEAPLIEKKQSYDYICWATALASVLEVYPDASWEIIRFDGVPYLKTEVGYFVEVSMTINDITRTMLHAVANGNRANKSPSSTDIFNSTQRALAKVIAVHGFGLQLWEKSEREAMRKEQAEWEKTQNPKDLDSKTGPDKAKKKHQQITDKMSNVTKPTTKVVPPTTKVVPPQSKELEEKIQQQEATIKSDADLIDQIKIHLGALAWGTDRLHTFAHGLFDYWTDEEQAFKKKNGLSTSLTSEELGVLEQAMRQELSQSAGKGEALKKRLAS